jgi:hypothetical protein
MANMSREGGAAIIGCGATLEMLKALPAETLVELHDAAVDVMQRMEAQESSFRLPTFDAEGPRLEPRIIAYKGDFVVKSQRRKRDVARRAVAGDGRVRQP